MIVNDAPRAARRALSTPLIATRRACGATRRATTRRAIVVGRFTRADDVVRRDARRARWDAPLHIDAEVASFGRRREDGVRVSPRALLGAIAVACAAALAAHEVGRSTGARLGLKAGLGLCSCECRCDSDGGGGGGETDEPALSVARGAAANMPKTLLDVKR